jgi:hypothetical protein
MNQSTTSATTGTTGSVLFPKKKKGEPHRIYWQQWTSTTRKSGASGATPTAAATTTTNSTSWLLDETSLLASSANATTTTASLMNDEFQQYKNFNRRELIMSSVAIRLSRSAKVMDVTTLLRQTIQLPDPNPDTQSSSLSLNQDCLVLVGTIYTLHKGFIQYQHTLHQPQATADSEPQPQEPPIYDEPYHIVHTLQPEDSPLLEYEKMEQYIINFLDRYNQIFTVSSSNSSSSSLVSTVNANDKYNDTTRSMSVTPSVTPKIQWYYIPAVTINPVVDNINNSVGSLIPNCVELDGYCTSMDDNDDSDMDDIHDENTDGVSSSLLPKVEQDKNDSLCSVFPWLSISKNPNNAFIIKTSNRIHEQPSSSSLFSPEVPRRYSSKVQRKLQHEEYLYSELCSAESQTPPHACIKGYLLYRNSQHDTHAWTRMYCVLTNHDMWYVSRIYTRMDYDNAINDSDTGSSSSACNVATPTYRYVRHGRIRLTRAILIQPTVSDQSLFRIPYSFELVSSDGTSHLFRTGSKYQQTVWITSISERIITSYECSLLENAQLITTEECYARNRRATTLAVEPLWDQAIRVMRDDVGTQQKQQPQHPSIGNSIGSVLRFGMDVSTFKDRCRFVRSTMPTRTPIVVAATTTSSQLLRRRFFSSSSSSTASQSRESSTTDVVKYEPYAAHIQSMIRVTWDQATSLLSRARSLALTLHVRSSIMHRHDMDTEQQREPSTTVETANLNVASPRPIRLSHGIDTLCRHIDFVLTGRLDGSSPSSSQTQVLVDHVTSAVTTNISLQQEDGPPPDDLFDHVLTELQLLAAAADYYHANHKRGGGSASALNPTTLTPNRQ